MNELASQCTRMLREELMVVDGLTKLMLDAALSGWKWLQFDAVRAKAFQTPKI